MQQCLGGVKERIILVKNNQVPKVRLRLALADTAPYWQALQSPVIVE